MPMSSLRVALSGEREVIITRSFSAPRERVWACHTRPELVRRWLLGPPGWTMPTCEIDLRDGALKTGMTTGMEMSYSQLDSALAGPELLDVTPP